MYCCVLRIAGDIVKVREELLEKMNELAKVKEELDNANIKLQEMKVTMEVKNEEVESNQKKIEEQEKEIKLLKDKIKDFKYLAENLEVLEKTRRRAEDLEVENIKLRDQAEQANSLQATVEELSQQKNELVKEFTILKSHTYEEEQKMLKEKPKEEYKVIEEIKSLLLDAMLLCKTLNTLSKEESTTYKEKLNKIQNCIKFLPEYIKTVDKQERLNLTKILYNDLQFLNYIPKKTSYIDIIDACVVNTLKDKEEKVILYEDSIAKYEEISKVAARKCSEFELKLSCYNLSES